MCSFKINNSSVILKPSNSLWMSSWKWWVVMQQRPHKHQELRLCLPLHVGLHSCGICHKSHRGVLAALTHIMEIDAEVKWNPATRPAKKNPHNDYARLIHTSTTRLSRPVDCEDNGCAPVSERTRRQKHKRHTRPVQTFEHGLTCWHRENWDELSAGPQRTAREDNAALFRLPFSQDSKPTEPIVYSKCSMSPLIPRCF